MYYYYYYFYENLYCIPEIEQAYKLICLNKILWDGYLDMSLFLFGRIHKDDMLAKLKAAKSKYADLYELSYPKKENALERWNQKVKQGNDNNGDLTTLEAEAIVNWTYRALNDKEERIQFTKELFAHIKDLHDISNKICYTQGVFYNKKRVDLHFFSSISSLNRFISSLKQKNRLLFYRGHANANYMLLPSIMRSSQLKDNESNMYHELQINCPSDFEKCHSHLEKLVEMQHYGLPTRMLDITRNVLVALFFACEDCDDTHYGEIITISADEKEIKYPQSDTVSILSSLPAFSSRKQNELKKLALDPSIDNKTFNALSERLIHEIRLEKPAFQPEINKDDVLHSYIVYALKNNNRIIKQDGAFILCGLINGPDSLEHFRYEEKEKRVIILISKKSKIIDELENFSINRASLFPEIDCVADYLKKKYS